MKVNLQSKTNFKKPVSYLQEKVIDSRNPNRNDLVKTIISTQNEKPKYQEKEFVIAIDAGHGGNDPGTHSTSGQYEKHIVLRFAKEFADHINRTTNMRAVLTRTSDYYIPLRDRTQIARRMNADIFISIHADSLTSHADINGMSVYSLSENASDEEAAALANADNKSDIIAGVDLSKQPQYVDTILFDLAQRETNNYSYKFAKILVDEVKKVTKMINKPHRQAGFAVLKAPDLPSVLVELGFLTNSIDERNLNSSTWRRQVVISMTRALLIWKDKKRN
jgi:N-acetylmuramoyl-L-alanine amidase